MANWQIKFFGINGVLRSEYSDINSGGFTEETIEFVLNPSGDCESATLQYIPSLVNVEPLDLVEIFINGTRKWYGYVNEPENKDSSQVSTLQCLGVKQLLYKHYIDLLWVRASSGDKLSVSQIVTALQSYLPSYVNSTITNSATTSLGLGSPVVRTNFNFGEMMDELCGAASNSYVWGVDKDRNVFIKIISTTALTLTTATNRRLEITKQNVEDIVTAVKFVFSYPESFVSDLFESTAKKIDTVGYGAGGQPDSTNQIEAEYSARGYSYSWQDNTAVATYGKFVKEVPLVISDSLVRIETMSQWATRKGTTPQIAVNGFQTQAGSTTSANIIAALDDSSETTFIRPVASSNTVTSIQTVFLKPSGFDFNDFLGIRINMKSAKQTEIEYIANYNTPTGTAAPYGFPVNDFFSNVAANALPKGTYTRFFFPRAYQNYLLDPTQGTFYYDFFNLNLTIQSLSSIDVSDAEIYTLRFLSINTTLLDNYAKELIKTPASYPSKLMTDTDYGVAFRATIKKKDGVTNVTEDVKKITHKANKEGYWITYELGVDENKDDILFKRITQRDDSTLAKARR